MNKFYKFSVTITVGVLLFVVSSFSQVSERKNDSALLTAQSYSCDAAQEFFLDTLVKANKPGGLIVIKNSCSENAVFPVYESEEFSLDERLNLITQMNPNYKWTDELGVINLAPNKPVSGLLNVQIDSFKLTDVRNLNLVIDTILRLPEVEEKLKKLKLKEGVQFGGIMPPPSNRSQTEMVFKDKTLQQILNEIVKKRGRGVWVYSEFQFNGENTFSLRFLVQ